MSVDRGTGLPAGDRALSTSPHNGSTSTTVDDALRESQERLALMEHVARLGTWEWDLTTGLVQWSASMESIYGLAPGAFGGSIEDFLDLVHPDDRDHTIALVEGALSQGGPLDLDHRILLPTGEVRWLHGRGRVLTDDRGEPVRMIGVGIDVTDRVKDDIAVREREERFSALLDAMPAHIVTLSPTGEIEAISESYQAYTGLTLEQARRWESRQIIHPDDHDHAIEEWQRAIREGIALSNEMRVRRHDGVYRWFLVQVVPIRDSSGGIARWLSVSTDIEDRKVREMRERFLADATSRMASLSDPITILREVARIAVPPLADICAVGLFDSDPALARIETAGATERERPLVDRIHLRSWRCAPGDDRLVSECILAAEPVLMTDFSPDFIRSCAPDATQRDAALDVQGCSIACLPLIARGEVIGMVTFATTQRSGRRYSEADVAFLLGVASRASIAVDNARLLADLRETAADLRRANAAKDEFLGLVSHELKTPITTILGNAEVLARRFEQLRAEDRMEALADIRLEAERLHRIIENLLILARLERGQVLPQEPILLRRVVERVVASFNRMHPYREINVHWDEELTPVLAQEEYIEQTVRNMLSNADKYSPKHAPIDIEGGRAGEEFVVRVTDRGPGVPEEETDQIFTPFFRSSSTSGLARGVGIGLAVCKRLMEAQGGRVWARRISPAGGSEFGFAVPAAQDVED